MRVDIEDGVWAELKDELSTAEVEAVTNAAQTWDAASGQWKPNGLTGSLAACDWIVVEWAVPGNPAPSAEAARALPARIGLKFANAIAEHVLAQGLSPEDLGRAS